MTTCQARTRDDGLLNVGDFTLMNPVAAVRYEPCARPATHVVESACACRHDLEWLLCDACAAAALTQMANPRLLPKCPACRDHQCAVRPGVRPLALTTRTEVTE